MTYLKGKKYVEPTVVKIQFPEAEVKASIKALVPENGKKDYQEIAKTVEQEFIAKGVHLQSDELSRCIKEVDAEWHPVEVVFETTPITE